MSTQAVVDDTDQESQQTSNEVDNAQDDDLDTLLKEFDTTDQENAEPAREQQSEATVSQEDVAEIRQFRQERQQAAVKEAFAESAKLVKEAAGEIGNSVPEWIFEGALLREDFNNPKIGEAFQNRDKNPEAWSKIAASIGKKIASDFKTDRSATESWNAVESAQRSASTSTAEESLPDFNKMTDSEFAKWKMENG